MRYMDTTRRAGGERLMGLNLAVLFVLGWSAFFSSTAHAQRSACVNDSWENSSSRHTSNDTLDQASIVEIFGPDLMCSWFNSCEDPASYYQAPSTNLFTTGFTLCPYDTDFYKFTAEEGQIIQVKLGFDHQNGDLTLALFDTQGHFKALSANAADHEYLSIVAPTTGRYAIGVLTFARETIPAGGTPYTMEISVLPFTPRLVKGEDHTCYLYGEGPYKGRVVCWGDNSEGQLQSPQGQFVQISAARDRTCALSIDGQIECWGSYAEPPPPGSYSHVHTGDNLSCALDLRGRAHCWAQYPTMLQAPAPDKSFKAIATDVDTRCGILHDDTLHCWNSESSDVGAPAGEYDNIDSTDFMFCALNALGTRMCWNGDKVFTDRWFGATMFSPDVPFAQASPYCGVKTNGELECWGESRLVPPPQGKFLQVTSNHKQACAEKANGQVICWDEPQESCDPADDLKIIGEPYLLSETGLYSNIVSKTIHPKVRHFTPAYPLWSDGSEKSRWIFLPGCTTIDTDKIDNWEFPVGTITWKEFKVGGKRVETRVIHRFGPGENDYQYLTYRWNRDKTNAYIVHPAGIRDAAYYPDSGGLSHDIPSVEACKKCHANGGNPILGFSAVQLSHGEGTDFNQLIQEGLLSDVPSHRPTLGDDLAHEALGFLHANCGHCHNEDYVGPWRYMNTLDRMNLRLRFKDEGFQDTQTWKTAVGVTGATSTNIRITPGDPSTSVVYQRMQRLDLDERGRMPQIGNKISSPHGMQAVADWIESLEP